MSNTEIPESLSHGPLVSITICTYNGEGYLQQTLDSVLAQTYRHIEIIIVDDGSRDGTREIIKNAAASDPRVRPVFKENGGLASARNRAFMEATGDWIAIIDQDDLCYPNRIEEQLRIARANPDADLIFCNTDYIDERSEVIGEHLAHFDLPSLQLEPQQAANLLLKEGCFIDSEAFFMRKSAITALGPLVERYSYVCDYDFFIRAGFSCKFCGTDKKLAAWRIHQAQATKTNKKKNDEMLAVYRTYIFHPQVSCSTKATILVHMLKMKVRAWLGR
ncbi:glycosyltransferase family 2 protein [Geomonas anaerohicana]|uniref:Glycosyltransferase n=1 Tax=Geomonas anaerohicana TaxID=2798583 RepID=A0ABS0YIP8_9BACT|nr:glycosyltransferase [Geomonas anaerohicana]MBJ6752190.1 glycosyltransferase [Geomonas anaerohicana]